ncbi:acyl-CoA dehydrogenase family protein [Sphingobium chlorophenolicum]|uniref:Acyl-CoA dehydrogenase domain-containing protein n=1 Tax=Sphingobium chlorophenolicum TaxID=46429 RepID=A0A081REE3_SPHCR|nr:acyl-CoA dehydrogenase [Sphingobium chlorophenolicum]KEQ53566.1 Acyl-CoA dehydrogenase domain-containing protein [Sphingobium chlorophenolicum]
MSHIFNEDQSALQDAVRAFLAHEYGWEKRGEIIASDAGWSPDIWRRFAVELGLLGLSIGEEAGGIGGDAYDRLAVMEALGEALVVEPFAETAIFAAGLLQQSSSPLAADLIGAILSGDAVVAVALDEPEAFGRADAIRAHAEETADGYHLHGDKAVVVGAPWSSHLIVGARLSSPHLSGHGLALFLVDTGAENVARRDFVTIDGKRASEIRLDGVSVGRDALLLQDADAQVDLATDEMTAALCGEAVGVLGAMLRQTVRYMLERQQFGRPLSEFQALQHRIADMRVSVEIATAVAFMAAEALGSPRAQRVAAISAAKVTIAKSCRMVSQAAVQLHGGMGMTNELPIGHLFKRAMVIERQFGGITQNLLRMASVPDHGLI